MSPQDTPDIDISPGQWQLVRGILQRHVPAHEVWAFVSRAARHVKTYLDLYQAVITRAPLPLDVSVAVLEEFAQSSSGPAVDR
jgi:DNA polymerase beta domain protein region